MRMTKTIIWSAVSLGVAIITGELLARCYLGLGTPPLSVPHPRIEYMYKPNQDVYRFGNHFIVNQYGMRTEPFATSKEHGELRVMVFGDSVLNGGHQTDHSDLATTLVRDRLTRTGYKKVVVGNISAGSWGPGNWLAYAKEYGFFDADAVLLVISSHDYADNPTFQPLNKSIYPTVNPVSALLEGIQRYLPRHLPQVGRHNGLVETDRFAMAIDEQEARRGLDDLGGFLELAKKQSKTVVVLQHFEKSEIDKRSANPGYQRIKVVCKQLNVVPISLGPYIRRSIESGANPYRDNIHPNKVGQQLIAEAIMANLPNPRKSSCVLVHTSKALK